MYKYEKLKNNNFFLNLALLITVKKIMFLLLLND